MRQDNIISYADLEALGWPNALINDYQGLKRELAPIFDVEADPNGIYEANLCGQYFDTNLGTMWINDTPGDSTGWVQIV